MLSTAPARTRESSRLQRMHPTPNPQSAQAPLQHNSHHFESVHKHVHCKHQHIATTCGPTYYSLNADLWPMKSWKKLPHPASRVQSSARLGALVSEHLHTHKELSLIHLLPGVARKQNAGKSHFSCSADPLGVPRLFAFFLG